MPFKDEAARKAWSKRYYQENKEEIKTRKHQFYEENKEEITAEKREAYQDPEQKIKQQEINKKSYLKNRDKILLKNRKPKKRFQWLISYAKKRELPCTLTEEQFTDLISRSCSYCENQLGSPSDSTGAGLDRLDNDRGYELDNVAPSCAICNRVRNDHFTPEETKVAVRAVIEFRKR